MPAARPRFQRLSLIPLLGLALLVSCSAPTSPHAPPALKPQASIWPPRWSAPTTGIIFPLEAPHGLAPIRLTGTLIPNQLDKDQAAALVGRENLPRVRFEDEGCFAYRPRSTAAPQRDRPEYFTFISAPPRPPSGPIPIQRTWFAYYEPATPLRGTALLMPGLFGTPYTTQDLFVHHLRAHGWAVLRMMSQPSRFTEKTNYSIDPANPDPAIVTIASDFGQRTAECGYAVEAAFDYTAHNHPETTRLPRIAIGMSGGAITLPTVLARDPSAYAAAVIIAGGANFFAMTRETNYVYLVDSIHYQWLGHEPTAAQLQALDDLYLRSVPLDAYNTAPALRGKPILMLQATLDGAVPAHLGDLLWDRLDRPERWLQTAGHEELFFKLPQQMDRIMAWLDAHTPAPTPAGR